MWADFPLAGDTADVADYARGMENDTIHTAPVATEQAEQELVENELLVEEISIDGMCGVY